MSSQSKKIGSLLSEAGDQVRGGGCAIKRPKSKEGRESDRARARFEELHGRYAKSTQRVRG
jgi:hypothetical protein